MIKKENKSSGTQVPTCLDNASNSFMELGFAMDHLLIMASFMTLLWDIIEYLKTTMKKSKNKLKNTLNKNNHING